MLDSQIQKAAEKLGVHTPEDWTRVRPEEIRTVHGCGPQTVNHLRLYLAARGLTLRDDGTPAYWQQNLAAARIGTQIAKTDKGFTLPFTVLVDVQEKQPYRFEGFRGDSEDDYRPMLVPTQITSLGPTHGDYSIAGFEGEVHIERKGVGDAIGTFLAHGERRDRWLNTLKFLAGIPAAAIVVECSLKELVVAVESRGGRDKRTLQRTLYRQVAAWAMDYRVPFFFCDERRFAERMTLQLLRRHYKHAVKGQAATGDDETESLVNNL